MVVVNASGCPRPRISNEKVAGVVANAVRGVEKCQRGSFKPGREVRTGLSRSCSRWFIGRCSSQRCVAVCKLCKSGRYCCPAERNAQEGAVRCGVASKAKLETRSVASARQAAEPACCNHQVGKRRRESVNNREPSSVGRYRKTGMLSRLVYGYPPSQVTQPTNATGNVHPGR